MGLGRTIGMLAVAGLAAAPVASATPECDPGDGDIELPEGFCALVVAELDAFVRHLAVTADGDIYVAMRDAEDSDGGLVALRDESGDGRADTVERFFDQPGTGMALRGDYLYFGAKTEVLRFRLGDGLVPQADPEVVVDGFPEQEVHAAKPVVFDDAGHLYVNAGAPSNNCQVKRRTQGSPGRWPCPELELSGGVWRYDADATGQAHDPAHRYASGIRNAVAMDWNPADGELYVVQHGRDQLSELWPEHFDAEANAELPAEEMLRVTEGGTHAWPYCYYDHHQQRFVLAPEYNGDGLKTGECDQYPDPVVAFPAHFAPNDLLFYRGDAFPERYRGGAFVAFHGSWNRAPQPQRGYKVAFVPFAGDRPAGEWEVFADDFAGLATIQWPSHAEHRPMGLAEGPDGSLYISDSQQGRIWRVLYTGK